MKNSITFKNYLFMVSDMVKQRFLKQQRETKRALIFFFRNDMCTAATEHLKKIFPDFKIKRYCEDDTEDGLYEQDIVVSNLLNAGTALDFPDLTWVYMTTCIDSPPANVQAIGRIREIKGYLGNDLEFAWLSCPQISKHVEYERGKIMLFSDRVMKQSSIDYRMFI